MNEISWIRKRFAIQSPKKHQGNLKLFADQFVYGHREILLDYLGLDYEYGFCGRIQHGITPNSSAKNFKMPIWNFKHLPYWVFSKELEKNARNMGFTHVRAIGAPWNYMSETNIIYDNKRKDILFMPDHSTSTYRDVSSFSLKKKKAKALRKIAGNTSTATVCLYYLDYLNMETRLAYEEEGFYVTALGAGKTPIPWAPVANRIEYLYNLKNLFRSHSSFVTDTFSTPLLYAISCNLPVGLFEEIGMIREINRIKQPISPSLFGFSQLGNEEKDLVHNTLRDNFNQINTVIDSHLLTDFFLGSNLKFSAEELRHVMRPIPLLYRE